MGCQWPNAGKISGMAGENNYELPNQKYNGRWSFTGLFYFLCLPMFLHLCGHHWWKIIYVKEKPLTRVIISKPLKVKMAARVEAHMLAVFSSNLFKPGCILSSHRKHACALCYGKVDINTKFFNFKSVDLRMSFALTLGNSPSGDKQPYEHFGSTN